MVTELEQYIPNQEVGHGVFEGLETPSFEDYLKESEDNSKEDEKEKEGDGDEKEDKGVKEDDGDSEGEKDDESTLDEPSDDDIAAAEEGKKTSRKAKK